jgi:hypothetical protein
MPKQKTKVLPKGDGETKCVERRKVLVVVCLEERDPRRQGGQGQATERGKGEREGKLTVAVPLLRAYSL